MSKHGALNTFGRSGNPALSAGFANAQGTYGNSFAIAEKMTLAGTVQKTMVLLACCFAASIYGWNNQGLIFPAVILGLIMAVVTVFKKEWAGTTAPVYAGLEGVALGGITAMYEVQFPGIGLQAISLTFGILFTLLLCYMSGMIKPTENFKLMIISATGGIFLVYLASFVLGFFGVDIGFIHSSGPIGIGFSMFVVGIAALNLVLDFDFIEEGAEAGLPKHMEWFGAFSLIVTLVWLYLEILRLLSKMRSR
ncbi:MAG: hypothetical protein CME30_04800 [Gemmatimonadetes bacterium]|nr:hypothetical protein [Gemmatimonadota bacterium]